MANVWDNSKAEGTALLLLLAIADYANEDGEAWPAVATLAHKIRLSERQTQYILKQLVASGELEIEVKAGRKHTNLYRILPQKVQPIAPCEQEKVQSTAPPTAAHGAVDCTTQTGKGAVQRAEKVQSTAPDPSVDPRDLQDDDDRTGARELPSSSSSSSAAAPVTTTPPTTSAAYTEIVTLYENNIGPVTSITSDAIKSALGQYPPEWLKQGIALAVKREKRDWRYVEGILRNWQTEGFGGTGGGQRKPGAKFQGQSAETTERLRADAKRAKQGVATSKRLGFAPQPHDLAIIEKAKKAGVL